MKRISAETFTAAPTDRRSNTEPAVQIGPNLPKPYPGAGTVLLGPPSEEERARWKKEAGAWLRDLDWLEAHYQGLGDFSNYLTSRGWSRENRARAQSLIKRILELIPIARDRIHNAEHWFICAELREAKHLHGSVSLVLGADLTRGLKMSQHGAEGNRVAYGSEEEKRERYDCYQEAVDAESRANPKLSYSEIKRRVAKKHGFSPSSLKRHTRNPRHR